MVGWESGYNMSKWSDMSTSRLLFQWTYLHVESSPQQTSSSSYQNVTCSRHHIAEKKMLTLKWQSHLKAVCLLFYFYFFSCNLSTLSFYVSAWKTALPNTLGFILIISLFSEIIQGYVCENATKRRKLDEEHETMTINVDTVGKHSIINISKDRRSIKRKTRREFP